MIIELEGRDGSNSGIRSDGGRGWVTNGGETVME